MLFSSKDETCACVYSNKCWSEHVWTRSQAAEQAKASPALVAKDPSTSTNKKEEEDLAKGEEVLSVKPKKTCTPKLLIPCWRCINHCLHYVNETSTMFKDFQGRAHNFSDLISFVCSYRAVAEGAASAAADLAVEPLPQHVRPALLLAQGRRPEGSRHLRLRGGRGQRAHLQVWGNHHHPGRQVGFSDRRLNKGICGITGRIEGSWVGQQLPGWVLVERSTEIHSEIKCISLIQNEFTGIH